MTNEMAYRNALMGLHCAIISVKDISCTCNEFLQSTCDRCETVKELNKNRKNINRLLDKELEE